VVFAAYGVSPAHAGAFVLLDALAAQFVFDFIGSCVSDAIGRGASLTAQLRESAWVYAVDAALAGVGLELAKNIHAAPEAALTLVPLLGLLAVFARERHQRLESLVELNDAYRGTALVLGDVVEADDGYTGEHSKSVVGLALSVADRLELSAEQRRNLEFAALLHDVGKIAIPKAVINKPGQLDPQEWRVIKTHTVEGQKMLDRVGGFMRDVGLIVRSHHERWDGGGYPDGLAGEAIPLEARIIACCDTWNAMRTDRSYRKALPHATALAELGMSAGSQLDPAVVGVLLSIVALAESDEPRREPRREARPRLALA
jgi:putative nucleotidyltransferase with HDIG domain